MNILLWVILGLAAGWLGSIVAGTNREQGMMADIVVGIIGALLGGFLANVFGGAGVTGFNLYSLFVATLGAVILLMAKKAFTRSY